MRRIPRRREEAGVCGGRGRRWKAWRVGKIPRWREEAGVRQRFGRRRDRRPEQRWWRRRQSKARRVRVRTTSGEVGRRRKNKPAAARRKQTLGLPKSSHEEQVASGQLGFLEAANCMKEETNSEKVACGDEENRKPVHSTDINSSCEKSDANGLADHASGISDALLISSLIAPANDNDEVHLSSSQSQLESTAFLDEPIGCSNSEELHQGLKEQCNERKEDQVASGACTSDMIEAATAKDLESGVTPLPAEERSNLRYEHLNSKLEGTEVVESGVSCDKDISNTLEFGSGSAMNSVGKRTPSDSTLPKDSSMDHYQQQEPSKDFSVEKSPEESAMCCENSVSRADNVPGTIEKPSFTTLDCKHEGAMFEEALHSLKNDAGRCSSNLKQSPIGLQFRFSQENMEGSGTHDALAFPSAENGVDESNVCHFECPVEKNVSSEPVSYQGSDEDLSRVKENGGCMFSSQQDNVQGLSNSSHGKDWVASAQLDSSEDVNHMEWEIIPEVVCKDEPAEHASGVSGTQYCSSQSTPICDDAHLSSNSLQLESLDAFDDLIAFANTEVLHQDHKDECNEHDEDQVIPGILASGMSESAPIEGSESGMTLLPASETSALPDEQLDRKLEGNEVVEHSLSCNKDTTSISDTGSVENNNLSSLPKDSYMDSCHEQQIPNDLSAPKSLEESAVCQDDSVHMDCFHEQELPSDLAAPKSPKESAICRDDGVSESIGICQTSRRRRIDEISTELLSFKISSTVKGSYIAMNAASTKQGDNLSQSAIALLRNRENTPAVKTDLPVKLNPDRTVAKNSSRRALQTITGRPRDH